MSETGLGLFRLSAIPVDRPEPAEALRTTVAWSLGLKRQNYLAFLRAARPVPLTASRCAMKRKFAPSAGLISSRPKFNCGVARSVDWLHRERTSAKALRRSPASTGFCGSPRDCGRLVLVDVQQGTGNCSASCATADGLQKTARPLGIRPPLQQHACSTSCAAVIFNDGYKLDPDDLLAFVTECGQGIAVAACRIFSPAAQNRFSMGDMVAAAS